MQPITVGQGRMEGRGSEVLGGHRGRILHRSTTCCSPAPTSAGIRGSEGISAEPLSPAGASRVLSPRGGFSIGKIKGKIHSPRPLSLC